MSQRQAAIGGPMTVKPWIASFRQPCSADEITVRVFGKRTGQASVPLVVYFHGGRFNGGSVEQAQGIAQALAGSVVVCVDYPLAPELHFPVTVEIAFEAVQWAWVHATDLGADPARVVVAGDQAGGNLAAAVAMMVRDRGAPSGSGVRLKGQVLINPMLDPHQATDSMRAADDCPCRKAWADYLPIVSDAMHPYAAPVHSRRLGGLASALVITAELDPLRDEAEQYAARLIAAGVPVQARRFGSASGDLVDPFHPCFVRVTETIAQFISDSI